MRCCAANKLLGRGGLIGIAGMELHTVEMSADKVDACGASHAACVRSCRKCSRKALFACPGSGYAWRKTALRVVCVNACEWSTPCSKNNIDAAEASTVPLVVTPLLRHRIACSRLMLPAAYLPDLSIGPSVHYTHLCL